jgi:phage gp46-like protein
MTINYDVKAVTLWGGDLAVFMDGTGSKIIWRGGQPVMDAGLETTIFMSLFTELYPPESKRGWFGNYLNTDNKFDIGSRFLESTRVPITVTSLGNMEKEAENALAWMINSKLAKSVEAEVTNPRTNHLEIAIRVVKPDLSIQDLLLLRNGVNWIYQTLDPAHGRTEDGS